MSSQKQSASEGSIALQSEGAITLNIGATKEELSALLSDFGKTLMNFHAEGQRVAEDRVRQFKDEVLARFEETKTADPKAFKDPDFQHALHEAQTNYVRSDDDQISESLVNLLTERSRYAGRNRASLCLNNAIHIVGNITREEIAALTLIFIVGRTIVNSGIEEEIVSHYAQHVAPLADDLPTSEGSIAYLVSLGCLTHFPFTEPTLWNTTRNAYDAAYVPPFTRESLEARVPGFGAKQRCLLRTAGSSFMSVSSLNYTTSAIGGESAAMSGTNKWRFAYPNKEKIREVLKNTNSLNLENDLFKLIDADCPSVEAIASRILDRVPGLGRVASRWEALKLGSYQPTPLGVTIGHSNAKRLWKTFNAPLTTWVS